MNALLQAEQVDPLTFAGRCPGLSPAGAARCQAYVREGKKKTDHVDSLVEKVPLPIGRAEGLRRLYFPRPHRVTGPIATSHPPEICDFRCSVSAVITWYACHTNRFSIVLFVLCLIQSDPEARAMLWWICHGRTEIESGFV